MLIIETDIGLQSKLDTNEYKCRKSLYLPSSPLEGFNQFI